MTTRRPFELSVMVAIEDGNTKYLCQRQNDKISSSSKKEIDVEN